MYSNDNLSGYGVYIHLEDDGSLSIQVDYITTQAVCSNSKSSPAVVSIGGEEAEGPFRIKWTYDNILKALKKMEIEWLLSPEGDTPAWLEVGNTLEDHANFLPALAQVLLDVAPWSTKKTESVQAKPNRFTESAKRLGKLLG